MSPARNKPPSDAIPASRIGPVECSRDDCPMQNQFKEWCDRVEAKVDKIDDTINGTDEKPGVVERLRFIEFVLKLFGSGAAVAAGVIITILVTKWMGG